MKQYKNINKKDTILYLLLLIFLILFIYSVIYIIKYNLEKKQNEKIKANLSMFVTKEPQKDEQRNDNQQNKNDKIQNEEYNLNFEELKKINKDTIGFLKVKGTDIEYVVVKTNNNEYYLKHNFEKKYNSGGWIFADYHNKIDANDKNVIIYGHNMRNGTMFCTLKNILNKEWQQNEENREIIFNTEIGNYKYQVFSVYQIKDEEYYIKTEFKNDEFSKFVKTIKARSMYDFGIEVSKDDSILTLSTCANDNRYRVVLHAKRN